MTRLACALCVLSLCAGLARADDEGGSYFSKNIELSLEVNGGLAWTLGDRLELEQVDNGRSDRYRYPIIVVTPGPLPPQPSWSDRVGSSQHETLGGRGSFWWSVPTLGWGPRFGFGGSLEGSYWAADSDFVTRHNVYRGGFLSRARLELLRSRALPHGIFRPYVGGGIGMTVSSVEMQLPPEAGGPVSDSALGISLSFRAGLQVGVTRFLSLYVEYGLEYVTAEVDTNLPSSDYYRDWVIDRSILSQTLVLGVTLSY